MGGGERVFVPDATPHTLSDLYKKAKRRSLRITMALGWFKGVRGTVVRLHDDPGPSPFAEREANRR